MSNSKVKEGDRAAVFQTTKVRTKLKGDCSWLQRQSQPQVETAEEKPWIAEVRASRLNGEPIEASPTPSPTKSTPPPTKTDTERAPTSGYLIRGIFTKLDGKPASSTSSTDFSGATQFSKKPSETYKRIAPHTVRSSSENQDLQMSTEEQEKRTEAASSVLKKAAVRERSYVLSAAKKFESKDYTADTPLVNSNISFVAKRVEIYDDDDSPPSPEPVTSPVTSVEPTPQIKPRKLSGTSTTTSVPVSAEKPVLPKVQDTVPDLVAEVDPAPLPLSLRDPFEDMKPGCTKVATPLPELIPVFVPAVSSEPEPEVLVVSGQSNSDQVTQSPVSTPEDVKAPLPSVFTSSVTQSPDLSSHITEVTVVTETILKADPEPTAEPEEKQEPVPELKPEIIPEPQSEVMSEFKQELEIQLLKREQNLETEQKLEPEPVLEPEPEPEPVPELVIEREPEHLPHPDVLPKSSSNVETLAAFYDTLIPFDTTSTSLQDVEPEPTREEGASVETRRVESSDVKDPVLSNCEVLTDDLLALTDSPEESAQPVPPSPGRWSQDLLGGLDSHAEPAKTNEALDLLADDVIPINTEARSLSTEEEKEKEKPAEETSEETQSTTETVTVTTTTVIITDQSADNNADPWSSHVTTTVTESSADNNADPWSSHVTTTVTESSSADPFDPYPIGTTSSNSSSDLLQPLADLSINSASTTLMENNDPSPETKMSGQALESLAEDIIPIDTNTTSLSTRRSWAHTWENSAVQQEDTKESPEPGPQDTEEVQQTLIMFERKSKENDSPWDRWTSPTVYTITTTTGEEEEEEAGKEEEQEAAAAESSTETHVTTVTTVTTIRETESELEPAMDRYQTYNRTVLEDTPRVQTPEADAKKGIVYVKEYVNTSEDRNGSADRSDFDYLTSSSSSYYNNYSSPSYSSSSYSSSSYSNPSSYTRRTVTSTCTYCGQQVGSDAKITIEHLNINCHPECFKCAVCSKPMGDLLYSMYLHGGKVHCESCYSKALD